MPITLKRRIIEETPIAALPQGQMVIKKRTIEQNPIQKIAPIISKGITNIAEKTLPIRPKLQEGTLFPETAFTDYDKRMTEQREVIKKRVLSSQPERPYAENVARELGGQALDIVADPKLIIAGQVGAVAGGALLEKALKVPILKTFAEKQLPTLLKGKLKATATEKPLKPTPSKGGERPIWLSKGGLAQHPSQGESIFAIDPKKLKNSKLSKPLLSKKTNFIYQGKINPEAIIFEVKEIGKEISPSREMAKVLKDKGINPSDVFFHVGKESYLIPTPIKGGEIAKPTTTPKFKSVEGRIAPITPKPVETPKYAENINLNRLPEGIRKPVAEVVAGKPSVGKTPKVTHAEIIKKASELGDTPTVKHLLSSEEGTFAAEVLKARQGEVSTINQILNKDLGELSKSIKTDLEQPISALRKVGAEVGRALGAQKITPFQKQNIIKKISTKIAQIDKDPLFKGSEAGKVLKEKLNALSKDITGDVATPSNWDKLYYVWLNSILSDPRTHMVNVGSNTLFALAKIPERFFAAMADLPLTGLGKLGVKKLGKITLTGDRQVFFGEVPAMIKGLLKKGVKSPKAIGSKFEQLNLYAGDKFLPTGWLQREDVWAKNVIGRMEMFAQLYKKQVMGKKGLMGLQAIKQEQLYRTFQNQPGVIANWIMSSRHVPYIGPALFRWIIPFVKTPANIINTAIERTPAGIAFLGKAQTQAQLSERLAYLGVASVGSAWAGVNYLKGNITGDAPVNPAERDAFYAQGKQPNAIKLFGFWVPFERIEPLGTALSLIVNSIQDYKQSDKEIPVEKVMDTVGGMAQTLTNKSYLQGMTNMMKAVSDPDRYGPLWAEGIVSGMATPGFLNYIAQLKDPYIRQAEGATGKMKARIPGLSKEVSPKLTVFGEKIERPTPYLPLRISKEKDDFVRKELENLGVTAGFPAKAIGKEKLSQEQYTKLLEEAGQKAKKALEWMFKNPEWKKMSQDAKEKEIDLVIRKTREFPREKMAMSILLNGIKDSKTDEELQKFLKKMKEVKVLTKERFDVLWNKGLIKK